MIYCGVDSLGKTSMIMGDNVSQHALAYFLWVHAILLSPLDDVTPWERNQKLATCREHQGFEALDQLVTRPWSST
jgi:hypothetical protein